MASIFKKLIYKELGKESYDNYFLTYQRLILNKTYDSKKLDNEEIYTDIYEKIKEKDVEELLDMMERLSDSMYMVLKISRTFHLKIIVYFGAIFILYLLHLPLLLTIGCISLASICFIYKIYEYVVNKYCFIDAHIVIIYKTVLDRLILIHRIMQQEVSPSENKSTEENCAQIPFSVVWDKTSLLNKVKQMKQSEEEEAEEEKTSLEENPPVNDQVPNDTLVNNTVTEEGKGGTESITTCQGQDEKKSQ